MVYTKKEPPLEGNMDKKFLVGYLDRNKQRTLKDLQSETFHKL